jgi:hypothetical protein
MQDDSDIDVPLDFVIREQTVDPDGTHVLTDVKLTSVSVDPPPVAHQMVIICEVCEEPLVNLVTRYEHQRPADHVPVPIPDPGNTVAVIPTV